MKLEGSVLQKKKKFQQRMMFLIMFQRHLYENFFCTCEDNGFVKSISGHWEYLPFPFSTQLLVGTGFGDPHIITLDGFEYTMNGLGEYFLLLVSLAPDSFTLQARASQSVDSTGI